MLQGKDDQIWQPIAIASFVDSISNHEEETSYFDLELPEELISSFIRVRRARTYYLPREIFADPAWDMLLGLLEAEVQGRQVSLEDICSMSGTSASSALRWLKVLESSELTRRRSDPETMDSDILELSPKGRFALRRYFYDIVQFANNLVTSR